MGAYTRPAGFLCVWFVLLSAAGCAVTQHEVDVPTLPARPSLESPGPERNIGLCLSGGGYRAALFHTGVLSELNDRGLLPRLRSIVGVSGGAIVAATLGVAWESLEYDDQGRAVNFDAQIVAAIDALTGTTLDVSAVLGTFARNGSSRRVAEGYAELLYGDARLADLPGGADAPQIMFLATEMVTGLNWEFARDRMGEARLGYVLNPDLRLADAVAASSAFPGFFRPVRIGFAADDRKLADPDADAVEAITLAALRHMGRTDLATRLETDGLPDADRTALAARLRAFREVAFAGKVDSGLYLIDGGLVNNLGSEYCQSHGVDLISNASLRWVGEAEPEPTSYIDSMAQTVVAMRRYAEAYQMEAIHHRSIVGDHFGEPCDAELNCPPGAVGLIEMSPRKLEGKIPDGLRVGARLREIPAPQRTAVIDWGRQRAAATLTAMQAD